MTNPATTIPPIEVRLQLQRSSFALDVDMQLPGRGITALFGPSGCGKTTCLRAMAGLEHAPLGWVRVHGEVWQNDGVQDAPPIWRPPHQRALGYVFQDSQLFDHLDVRGNIDYGLRRTPVAQRLVAVEQLLELLGIGALMERKPATLSGGERQRVAIARALATSPRLLLMDEPLAALDAQRKAEVLPYLERLHSALDIPVVYVSHALDEVARLAEHMVLLSAGRVRASGPTAELIARLDLPLAQGDAAAGGVERESGVFHQPLTHAPPARQSPNTKGCETEAEKPLQRRAQRLARSKRFPPLFTLMRRRPPTVEVRQECNSLSIESPMERSRYIF